MTAAEWESLCDGCGRCCLNKLEDIDTGRIEWTDVACRLLDGESCRCRNYKRRRLVPDCVQLTPESVRALSWLPPTCAYRLVEEGRDLYWWHPLVSGDPESVHDAGISVRARTVSEKDFPSTSSRTASSPGPERRRARRSRVAAEGRRRRAFFARCGSEVPYAQAESG